MALGHGKALADWVKGNRATRWGDNVETGEILRNRAIPLAVGVAATIIGQGNCPIISL